MCQISKFTKLIYQKLIRKIVFYSNESKNPYQNKAIVLMYNKMTPKLETSIFVSMDVP